MSEARPSRWAFAGLAVAALGLSGWFASGTYRVPGTGECHALYSAALTLKDTLAVDLKWVGGDSLAENARMCGGLRRTGRWFETPVFPETPERFLGRAIVAAGGVEALSALPALEWKGSATVHAPGKEIPILGTWRVAPPDTARVITWPADEDSSKARTLSIAGDAGWLQRGGRTEPMPTEQLAEERHQFYLYSLLRLLPLRDPAATLTLLPADSAGETGILVHRSDRLDVTLYFDQDQRVTRMRTHFARPNDSPGDEEEVRLEGTVDVAGVQWFRQMHILRNGTPYFDLVVLEARPGGAL